MRLYLSLLISFSFSTISLSESTTDELVRKSVKNIQKSQVVVDSPTEDRFNERNPMPPLHIELKECDSDNPCDNNSTVLEAFESVAARAVVFGYISADFISSYAVEFSHTQSSASVGGVWKNICMTSPVAEGRPDGIGLFTDRYIESGRIRFVFHIFLSA